jgi:hypothetical protein
VRITYDIETYPNVFTFSAAAIGSPFTWQFEISDWKNDQNDLLNFLWSLAEAGVEMVGFNNINFDYPVIHYFMMMGGKVSANDLYVKAMTIIQAQDKDRFAAMIYPSDRKVKQIDLFKIHHFDNKAKMTSLKAIEFNLRMDSVEDLPFKPGTSLTREQIPTLLEYNMHDVRATEIFYHKSLDAIELREKLGKKYGRDFINHNDVKIGKEIFQLRLEDAGVQCYKYGSAGREPMQTKRPRIEIAECIPWWIKFDSLHFHSVLEKLRGMVITQTKGAFSDMSCHTYGLDFFFGTGGLHASVENIAYEESEEMIIVDADVTSMYPSIAIVNGYYPEHLGEKFCEIYADLKKERIGYKKGTPENAALKLALNGTFGASNDQFSVFFDPLFTMKITIGGQLMLAMLADQLGQISGLQIIQANTDGITCYLPRAKKAEYDQLCKGWESVTHLDLEFVDYKKMFVADVNNYIALTSSGKVKRKGRYEYVAQWHQNASRMVVPKVAEKVLIENLPIRETLEKWPDRMDFMSRVKVPRSSMLFGEHGGKEYQFPNLSRYYVAKDGIKLTKIMPPLAKKPDMWRRIGVESGWRVCICNKIEDATMPVDTDYYINEVEKLTLGFREV